MGKGIRSTEGANINKSLLSLGNCINILEENSRNANKKLFVPYRDSKLTRLLKDSLGGNIQTTMIACISQNSNSYDETVNTLKYASRVNGIKKEVKKKQTVISKNNVEELINSLKAEISALKEVIKQQDIEILKGKNEIQLKKSNSEVLKAIQTKEQMILSFCKETNNINSEHNSNYYIYNNNNNDVVNDGNFDIDFVEYNKWISYDSLSDEFIEDFEKQIEQYIFINIV